jgi:hypothetical protein
LATQLRNSKLEKSKDNPFRSNTVTAPINKAAANTAAANANMVRPHSEPVVQQNVRSYNNNNYVSSNEYSGGGQADNVLTAVRGESGAVPSRSRKSAPKTPSPQKVDSILQKDINNKRRFALEDLQRQRDLDNKNFASGNDNSGHAPVDQDAKKPSKWTFPSKTANAASNQDMTSYSHQQQQKPPVRSSGMPFPSLSRIGSFGSKAPSNVVGGRSTSAGAAIGKGTTKSSSTMMHSGSNIISGDHDSYDN